MFSHESYKFYIMSKFGVRVYQYAGPWFSGVKKMASKAWREYGKREGALPRMEEPPSKKLGWARLNDILSGQIQANMAFNAKKKQEEDELRRKLEILQKKEKEEEEDFFRFYMKEEIEEVFTDDVRRRTEEWVAMTPQWTRETGTKVYQYDGPWHAPTAKEEKLEETQHGDLARNGWVFSAERCLASHLSRRLPGQ